jgi:hypothetical protein
MPHWLIKSGVHRIISWLPATHFWNRLLQQYFSRSMELTAEQFKTRLDHCRRHFQTWLETGSGKPNKVRVLELGTGWFPTVPVGLYLCGAEEIWTFDIAPLLRGERTKQMLERFEEFNRSGELQKRLPDLDPERLAKLREFSMTWDGRSPAELLKKMNIHYCVRDAQQTGLGSGTVDLFISTAVLEYIPREVVKSILKEFKRVGSRNAVQSHYINLRDHYSYFDFTITPFNNLKFTERQWRCLNSPIAWQSRLRISDYRALFAETGHQIIREENTRGDPEELRKVRLAPEFQHYSFEDLLVVFSWIRAASRWEKG